MRTLLWNMREERSAPHQQMQGIQRFLVPTDYTCTAQNTSAPQTALFDEIPQGIARRGFKQQHPARGRKLKNDLLNVPLEKVGI